MDLHHLPSRALRRLLWPLLQLGSVTFFVRRLDQPLRPAALPQGFALRRARPADLNALCAGRARPVASALAARLASGDPCFLVVDAQGRCAHSSWVSLHGGHIPEVDLSLTVGPDEAYGYDSWTAPAVRGRGLFAAVREHACSWLHQIGRRRLYTYVASGNHHGLRGAAHWETPIGRIGYLRLRGRQPLRWGSCPLLLLPATPPLLLAPALPHLQRAGDLRIGTR
jgi:hypothetical protein